MKSKIVMFAAAIAMSHSGLALAQSSTTSISPPEADPAAVANTSTAISSENAAVKPGIKYFGQLLGQGLKFSGTVQSTGYALDEHAAFAIDNRPKFFARIGKKIEAGAEVRFLTNFESKGWNVTNGNSRLFVNIKDIYKTDIMAVSFIPRAMLAGTNTAHNQMATVSPDFLLSVDLTPKNTRFTFNGGIELIKHFYSGTPSVAKNYLAARSLTFDPWLEMDYQLNPTVQLSASYWPDWATTRGSSHMDNKFQELDLGAYVSVAKGWQLMPYVGTNFNNFQASNALDNMQLNIALSGTVL